MLESVPIISGGDGASAFGNRTKLYESPDSLIYRARRSADDEPVVLKVLRGEYLAADEIARFEREYTFTRRIESQWVVRALDYVDFEGSPCIVLEDIGARDLRAAINAGLEIEQALEVGIRLTDALADVHQQHIVHKNIGPSNVLWRADTEMLKLIDFGISSPLSRQLADASAPSQLQGELLYISPEQTGRTNRAVDYRTDFYSLGATLYHMVAGRPPFSSGDPLELVHAHLAANPVPPHELNPDVPRMLSALIMRLLAKAADDRYQSAFGIRADLTRCLERLRAGEDGDFELGLDDRSGLLSMPARIYGRERELRTLRAAFERVRGGALEVLVIMGYAGIGKTALARQLHSPLLEARGSFVFGKFGQFQRDVPYSSLLQALRQVIVGMLADTPERVDAHRARLLEALGSAAPSVVAVLPALGTLLQVAAHDDAEDSDSYASSLEAENAFHQAFRRFVRCLATPEHPLVVFLDDLQWADHASLKLLEQLATDPDARHLLIIGAYRDNEVDGAHPVSLTLKTIEAAAIPIERVALAPLTPEDTRTFVAEMVRRDVDECDELARLCFEKTRGNPFFLGQFVQALGRSGELAFDETTGRWRWDIEAIRAARYTDNVVEFMVARARSLPEDTQRALAAGAALGPRFRLDVLAALLDQSTDAVEAALSPASDADLVLAVGSSEDGVTEDLAFTHDRVQQAAYATIPEDARPTLDLDIGRLLLARHGDGELEGDALFDIVNHLNAGRAHIVDANERTRLVELNLRAARRALAAAAHEPAERYIGVAIETLGTDGWQSHHRFTLDAHTLGAETAYRNDDKAALDTRIAAVLTHARGIMEKVRVHEIRIAAQKGSNQLNDALDTALTTLALLGLELPRKPHQGHIVASLLQTKFVLRRLDVDAMPHAKRLTSMEERAVMRILAEMMPSAYFARPNLLPLAAFEIVRRSVQRGIAPASAYGFVVYAFILCTMNAIDDAYAIGRMAVELAHRLGDRRMWNLARHIFNAHVRYYRDPWVDCLGVLRDVHRVSLEVGDHEYAAFGAYMSCAMDVESGRDLAAAAGELETYWTAIERLNQDTTRHQHQLTWQYARNLLGGTPDPLRLAGPVYDEAEMVAVHEAASDSNNLGIYWVFKLQLAVVFGRPAQAVFALGQARKHISAVASSMVEAGYYAYGALALLKQMHEQPNGTALLRRRVRKLRKKLVLWASTGPANFAHLLHLVDAELARADDRPVDALALYEQAISGARAAGHRNHLALAAEAAARFHAVREEWVSARGFLREAHQAYTAWGALAKVAQLDAEFGDTLLQTGGSRSAVGSMGATVSGVGEALDLSTVLKASRTISEQIVFDRLLEQLLHIVVESAGAERGAVILSDDGSTRVEAVAEGDDVRVRAMPLNEVDTLSPGIVGYVLRTGETVVLDDAALDDAFSRDDYVQRNQPRSLLAMPILHQGDVAGALYLENNLTPGAFTPGRLEMLHHLAGQVAVSLANAALYHRLEEKVRERTEELELRNRFIQTTFGRYLSNDVVESLLASPDGLVLGGETREVTVMMADLRGFTAMSEGLQPTEVVAVINNFLSAMTDIIMRYGGTIDEFLGDAILAIFGAPLLGVDDAERAVACAIEMQLAVPAVNRRNAERGLPEIAMGIGLNTGRVVVGNIGSERRAKYGVVGSHVNLAARVEGYTVGGEVLISEHTAARVKVPLDVARKRVVRPKGVKGDLEIWQIAGIGGRHDLKLERRDQSITKAFA